MPFSNTLLESDIDLCRTGAGLEEQDGCAPTADWLPSRRSGSFHGRRL